MLRFSANKIRRFASLPDPFKRGDSFAHRHIGPRSSDTPKMLESIGFTSMEVRESGYEKLLLLHNSSYIYTYINILCI